MTRFVHSKAVNRLATDHVKAKPSQEPTIANPLDATSGGNDHVHNSVVTSVKGGSGVPSTAKSNDEGSVVTKVSKSSPYDKEQKPCRSSDRYSSSSGRNRKRRSLSWRSRKYGQSKRSRSSSYSSSDSSSSDNRYSQQHSQSRSQERSRSRLPEKFLQWQ